MQRNPFLVVALKHYNAKSSNWFFQDKTNFEGDAIENLTSLFGLQQVINEPTYILDTSSSFIDLIFTSQPNWIIVFGVHLSLHSNCHHQLIFAKFNLEVVYPPSYVWEVWHYKDANTKPPSYVCGRFGTIKMLIPNSLGEQLMNSISKMPF